MIYSNRIFFYKIEKEQINVSVLGIEPGTPSFVDSTKREYRSKSTQKHWFEDFSFINNKINNLDIQIDKKLKQEMGIYV